MILCNFLAGMEAAADFKKVTPELAILLVGSKDWQKKDWHVVASSDLKATTCQY